MRKRNGMADASALSAILGATFGGGATDATAGASTIPNSSALSNMGVGGDDAAGGVNANTFRDVAGGSNLSATSSASNIKAPNWWERFSNPSAMAGYRQGLFGLQQGAQQGQNELAVTKEGGNQSRQTLQLGGDIAAKHEEAKAKFDWMAKHDLAPTPANFVAADAALTQPTIQGQAKRLDIDNKSLAAPGIQDIADAGMKASYAAPIASNIQKTSTTLGPLQSSSAMGYPGFNMSGMGVTPMGSTSESTSEYDQTTGKKIERTSSGNRLMPGSFSPMGIPQPNGTGRVPITTLSDNSTPTTGANMGAAYQAMGLGSKQPPTPTDPFAINPNYLQPNNGAPQLPPLIKALLDAQRQQQNQPDSLSPFQYSGMRY